MAVTSSGSICCRGDSRPTLSGVTAVRQDAIMVTVKTDAEAWLHADRARRSVIVPRGVNCVLLDEVVAVFVWSAIGPSDRGFCRVGQGCGTTPRTCGR